MSIRPSAQWSGVRVLALSERDGVAGPCARLMHQLGATVTGAHLDVDRGGPTEDSPGTAITDLETVRATLERDAGADADVLLVDRYAPRAAPSWVLEVARALPAAGTVVCVCSPYGLSGPMADHTGSELTVQASAGVLTTNGFAGNPPLMAGVPVATTTGAMLGVAAVGAALLHRRRTGRGDLIDLAGFDATVCLLGTLLPSAFLEGRNPRRIGNRHTMTAPWNTYRTTDGWVVMTIMGQSLWRRFVDMIGHPELEDQDRFGDAPARVRNVDELDEIITRWTSRRRTADVLDAAASAEVPAAPIRTVREALEDLETQGSPLIEHVGDRVVAGCPVGFVPNPTAEPAPVLEGRAPTGSGGPLDGVRVLELSAFTSAPFAGRLLGMLGADVLKVEPPHGENSRRLAQQIAGCGYLYHLNNTDKRGCVLDIRDAEQAEQLRELAADADVLLTNLAPTTLERCGVTYDDLAPRAPQLVYCGVTGFGARGSRSRDKAFDTMIQALSGIMSLTGGPDGPPTKIAISFVDLLGACAAAAGIVAALHARDATGTGGLVDAAMLDVAVWSTQQVWDEIYLHGRDPQRTGNTHAHRSPFGVYAAADGHVAIDTSCADERDTVSRAFAIEPAGDRATLEERVSRAVERRSAAACEDELQRAGVRAVDVLDILRLLAHPHTAARAMIQAFELRDGTRVEVVGSPFKFSEARVEVRRPAPDLGSDMPAWSRVEHV